MCEDGEEVIVREKKQETQAQIFINVKVNTFLSSKNI